MNFDFSNSSPTPQVTRAANLKLDIKETPRRYYRHGWQSWSLSAWTEPAPLPIQKPAIFHPLQIDPRYALDPNPHGSWLGALEFTDGKILLLGALTLDTHVFYSASQLRGESEAGEAEWFIAYGDEAQVFAQYATALGERFGRLQKKSAPRVWCSWYSLYTMIDEPILHRVFDELDELPFEVLQVDDGWQRDIGDWTPNEKFPSGMSALAEKIRATGRRAGLWLAPLIATPSSNLFRDHQNWLLRDERGKLVSAGFNWGQDLYALDTTRPETQAWLADLMKQVRSWGFDYLKLDFLYAGALPGIRHQPAARESAYRQSLLLMRQSMGADAFFLTCGTPILPALGTCDAMRVGPDVAGVWEKYRDAVLFYNPSIPATRGAIRTALNRYWLKDLLRLDPDVAYFTSTENALTSQQRQQLQDLALLFDFKATSDLPQWMNAAERDSLRAFLSAKPRITRQGRYRFMLDDRAVDFSAAVELPPPPRGAEKLWASFISWLGSLRPVLRIFKQSDDNALKKRRAAL